ncbi:MAG: hypothetical protein WCI73_20020, partial [Phycisphaerae bacterium]
MMNTHNTYRAWLASAVVTLAAATAGAETGPSLILRPFAPGLSFEGRTSEMVQAQTQTNEPGHPARLSINDTGFRLRLSAASTRGSDTQPGGQGAADEGWGAVVTDPVLGYQHTWIHLDTGYTGLPNNLLDQSVAVGGTFYRTDLWKFAALAGMGWAGKDPYADPDSVYGKASLVAERKLDAKSALLISLNYNGNATVFPDMPLPGVGYSRRESDTLFYTLGIPYSSVTWKPLAKLTLEAEYFVPFNFGGKASYQIAEALKVFAQYDSRLQAFVVSDD